MCTDGSTRWVHPGARGSFSFGGVRRHNPHSLTDMHALKLGIGIAWVVFWVFWLSAALWAKKGLVAGV